MNLSPYLPKITPFYARNKAAFGLSILIAAGYLGNYFRWSLFFDIDFLFGSIAVWIIVFLYGTGWGTFAGFISGICTYFIWHHPYTVITFTAEAFFVSLLFHRLRQNIVLLDGIFWLFIGMPLIWLFYAIILHVDTTQALIILLKQPVNGIFNALIASLMLTHLPIHKWLGRPQAVSTLSLQQTVFNLLVAFVFFPTLILMVLDSRRVIDNIKTTANAELKAASIDLVVEMRSWHQQHLKAVQEFAQIAADEPTKLDALQSSIEFARRTFPDFHEIYVVNAEGKAIASSPRQNEAGESTIGLNLAVKPYFKEINNTLQPTLSDVVNGQKVILSVPVLRDNRFRGLVIAELDLNGIDELLKSNVDERGLQITLVDRRKSVIASTLSKRVAMQTFDRRKDGEIRPIAPMTYQWLPISGSRLVMVRWNNSFFVQETPIDSQLPWTLIAELSATPDVRHIERVHTNSLAILMLISAIALIFATLLSRSLVGPLSKLAQVTTNLPHKLSEQELIDWPNSPVTELDALVRNFKSMAATLNQKFSEIKSVNEMLEERVQERTQKLLIINTELEAEISERQRTEEKLKAYTFKLEQSNRELQDFAFVASHDLQEPLRKIQAFGDRLKLKYGESLTNEGKDYLERMQKAAQRMQTLINDLLAFSRVTSKAQPFTRVNITNVLQEVLSDLEVHIQKVGAQVEIGELLTIDADPSQMRQLLQNLISNALKFRRQEEAPVVKIWSQLLEKDEQLWTQDLSARPMCQIMVEDNGIGFDEKYLDRIFTVFQRLHGRNEYEGTGVGLAICRKIVERHGGTITAKSILGEGATFIVTLPVKQSR
ncbi:ATP-binding protein [Trichocoleus sp. ST-U3]|uniref:ATP-binding protein n=1 Tax=Coleofasciculus sp. FACHB-542 TaxID=2692787 RepID=UPI001F556CB9|nr:ATP-binding protein [Coleofasciculus sp. FACHB-542]